MAGSVNAKFHPSIWQSIGLSVIPFGCHAGKSYEHICHHHPQYVEYCANKPNCAGLTDLVRYFRSRTTKKTNANKITMPTVTATQIATPASTAIKATTPVFTTTKTTALAVTATKTKAGSMAAINTAAFMNLASPMAFHPGFMSPFSPPSLKIHSKLGFQSPLNIQPMPKETKALLGQLAIVADSLKPYLKSEKVNMQHKDPRGAIRALKKDPTNSFLLSSARSLAPKKTVFIDKSEL